ncbi:MAG: B12-binding domain-containing radical SAM protein [bacterium]
MNITLVEPQKYVSATNHASTVAMPPLGPAYVAASLEQAGHRVTLVDAFGMGLDRYTPFGPVFLRGVSNSEAVAAIPANTDVIGVSCMFSCQWPATRLLLAEIKRRFPDIPLVMGGEHANALPEFSLSQAALDVAVLGEGEETAVHLMEYVSGKTALEDIPGIVFLKDGKPVSTGPRKRIRNVDAIPRPAWHLVDIERYMRFNQPHGAAQGRFMPMLATRGCPFECTFCSSPGMWTQQWIPRDPKKVVDEIESYMQHYEATDFQFEDLTAIVRRDWIADFCQEILRRQLRITWQLPSGTRSEAINAEATRLMKQAGCHEFSYAPESGCPETLRIIKKKVSLDKLFQSAKDAMASGINVGCFFIIGFPSERWRNILRTYRAIAKCAVLGFSTINVNAFSPQPHTELYRDLMKQGKIKLDDDYFYSLFTFQDQGRWQTSYNDRLKDWQLSVLVKMGLLLFFGVSFLCRPWRLAQVLADPFRAKSKSKLGKYLRGMRTDFVRIAQARRAIKQGRVS